MLLCVLFTSVKQFFISVWFGQEGHVIAMPRKDMMNIRGEKITRKEDAKVGSIILSPDLLGEIGATSYIPHGFAEGNEAIKSKTFNGLKLTMPMSFTQKEGTGSARVGDGAYAFLDHDGLLRIHIMRKNSPVTEDDFKVSSEVWPYLWTKGPVPSDVSSRDETQMVVESVLDWRTKSM